VHVHICNLAAQTGASLFTHAHDAWTYNKTENLTPAQLRAAPFTHLLAETPADFAGAGWTVRESVRAFDGWVLERDVRGLVAREGVRGLLGVLRPRTVEKLWIVERA
jgi:alpha-1,6-mannosyltransferase